MSRIIKMLSERQTKTCKEYRREFQRIGEPENCGYSFPCNPDGSPNETDSSYEYWKENYNYCLEHPDEYEDQGIVRNEWSWKEPAVGKCSCGCEVRLSGDTPCEGCGQWYNAFGQALLDPEYWEEDYYLDEEYESF